jgi:hypothetical protein
MTQRRLAQQPTSIVSEALRKAAPQAYSAFSTIDGRHPWQDAVPEGFVAYPVRQLKAGKVVYFNFDLAREMGLITETHRNELTPDLTQAILDTFCIQIINEYDQANGTRFPKGTVKEHKFMATRYLQLQHSNKQGKTSGDGRSIWNGSITNQGVTWGVSSRGTGVTSLAPGSVQANRPLKTGEGIFGYGCGLADVDELYGSALMSEIYHRQGLETERVLTVIDLGHGCGIGVRAAPNLLRPAHLFLYMKQGRWEPLKQAIDYFIRRQRGNGQKTGQWTIGATNYDALLQKFSESFARFTAHLERQYMFVWMDWDGDNVLANGGIIDYGSVRQFGLRHDQYRYDDVERFSTNLNEQRGKARMTVQVFAQTIDFLKTKKKRILADFDSCQAVREFDRIFDLRLREIFLEQVGYAPEMVQQLIKKNRRAVEDLYQTFSVLERTKTKAKMQKVPDGINRPAVFKMRSILRELPSIILKNQSLHSADCPLSGKEFLQVAIAAAAKRYDSRLTPGLQERIDLFQRRYVELIHLAARTVPETPLLKQMSQKAQQMNFAGRITGNSIEFLVSEILKSKKRGLSPLQAQQAMELFISHQTPAAAAKTGRRLKPVSLSSDVGALYQKLIEIAYEFEDEI